MSTASQGRAREHRVRDLIADGWLLVARSAGSKGAADRFWSKVEPATDGCWVWTGGKSNNGYGRFTVGSSSRVYAHRFAYEDQVGPIPDGLVIDHLCRNRACVNPAHLEAVTNRINTVRGEAGDWQRSKTHCPSGHAYTTENTRIYRTWRYCRSCERERSARRRGAA